MEQVIEVVKLDKRSQKILTHWSLWCDAVFHYDILDMLKLAIFISDISHSHTLTKKATSYHGRWSFDHQEQFGVNFDVQYMGSIANVYARSGSIFILKFHKKWNEMLNRRVERVFFKVNCFSKWYFPFTSGFCAVSLPELWLWIACAHSQFVRYQRREAPLVVVLYALFLTLPATTKLVKYQCSGCGCQCQTPTYWYSLHSSMIRTWQQLLLTMLATNEVQWESPHRVGRRRGRLVRQTLNFHPGANDLFHVWNQKSVEFI